MARLDINQRDTENTEDCKEEVGMITKECANVVIKEYLQAGIAHKVYVENEILTLKDVPLFLLLLLIFYSVLHVQK